MFECSPERWTQSSQFMGAFPQRALNSSNFARPAAKFIHKNLKAYGKETERKNRMTDNFWNLPESSLSSSKSLEKQKYHKIASRFHSKSEEALKESEKNRKDQMENDKSSPSSFKSPMSIHNFSKWSKGFLLSKLTRLMFKQKIREKKGAKRNSNGRGALRPSSRKPKSQTWQAFLKVRRYRLSCICKLMKTVKSQTKAHFFNPKKLFSEM